MKTAGYSLTVVVVLAVSFFAMQAFSASDDSNKPAGPGYQHMRHRSPGPTQHMGFGRPLHQLKLTQEQTEQIKAIHQAERENAKAAREAIVAARQALNKTVIEGADEADIRTAAIKLGNAIADEAVKRAATMASVRKVLTDEQSAKLKELIAERTERRQESRKDRPDTDRQHRDRRPSGREEYKGRQQGPRDDQDSPPRRGLNLDRLFDRFDSDGDGKLTREELEAMSKQMENRPPRPW